MNHLYWIASALVAVVTPVNVTYADTPAPTVELLTPPMGWNSWNTFQTKIDEALIKDIADTMLNNGMKKAGYIYVNLDDGWSEKKRDANGELVPDKSRFPGGMKTLGDYLHDHGFKFGIYNCCGTETCAHYPGTKGHEEQDMKTYAAWGVDYIKMDWCNTEGMNAPESYQRIRRAIDATGRPMVLSICEWGNSKPWTWAKGVGQMWRTTGDIMATYEGKNKWSTGWHTLLESNVELAAYAGPGHWNDPDMLEVGVGELTPAESKAHFSFWCMLSAPLIAGNDVRHMDETTRAVLTNKELIAVDQDPLGKQAIRVISEPDREVWVKELAGGDRAVILHNRQPQSGSFELKWSDLPQLNGSCAVRDLWGNKDLGTTNSPASGDIEGHGVRVFRLKPQ